MFTLLYINAVSAVFTVSTDRFMLRMAQKTVMSLSLTVVARIIRTLVFSPAKKMVLSQLFVSFAVVCQ